MAYVSPSPTTQSVRTPLDRGGLVARIRRIPLVAAITATVFGVAVLEGYVFGIGPLVSFDPFLPPTRPLTAVLFLFAGLSLLALWLEYERLRKIGALVTALVAALVLTEHLFSIDLGIDTLLFADAVRHHATVYPGRPPPISALTFFVVGILLWAAPPPNLAPRRWYSALVGVAVVLPFVAVVGHVFGAAELYTPAPGSGTALHTALVAALLSIGIALATHEGAIVELLVGREPRTMLLRRLLPLAVLLPLLFTAGSLAALRVYQTHLGVITYVMLFVGVSVWAAFRVGDVARRADAERRAADRVRAELELHDRLLEAEMAARAVLRESEHRNRELLEILSHTPVLARGLDGRIRFWSSGAESLYGWSSTEAVGTLVKDLLRTEMSLSRQEADAILLEAGEWHGELTRRARDGTVLQVASHWILHRDESGRADAVIEVDDDVTEQKQAREAVRSSEARYRALVDATARIVWTAAPDGRRAIDLTQWEAFTGQTLAEAAWGGWLKAIHPDDRTGAMRAWNDAVRARKPLVTQHRLRRRDGEYRHMEVRAVPVLDDHGEVREWIGAHTDVTDRIKAEEQLAQAQKLQAVGTLAGGVAHEVNNQLMAVLGFGDFVLKELGPGHPQAADVEEMIRGAMRAAKVAQQLLTFSRRQVNQSRPLDLHAATEALAPVLERLLGADKKLVLLPTKVRRQVLADPTQIDQVLINLAANARDAMGTGGRLTLVVDEVNLDESYARTHSVSHLIPGPHVRLTVSDNGCGMDRATLAKIFEPFFTTKPVGAGTGLGLSTVYGIIKQHNGFIWAYSEPGLGTTMKIYLPAVEPEPAKDAAQPRTEPRVAQRVTALEPGVVLVVEDEPTVRQMVRRSLEAAGLTVIEAENGDEALKVMASRKERPKLVLTDVIMPGLNGRELSEALAAAQPGLPVLFMSGYTGDDMLARSLLPASAHFIQKPFAPEELVARVRTILGGATSPPM